MPDNAPIAIFLTTLSGNGPKTTQYVKYAIERGYRCCVFNRRG